MNFCPPSGGRSFIEAAFLFFICLELTSSYNFDVKAKGGALKRVPPFLSKTRLIIPNLSREKGCPHLRATLSFAAVFVAAQALNSPRHTTLILAKEPPRKKTPPTGWSRELSYLSVND
ncbi:MAG: hypothetical protein E7149_04365 [Rikenellaceae bacterium]|nr:hypothetical protein [Rikenellaceae bacterium]